MQRPALKMSEFSSENPQILVNGENQEQQSGVPAAGEQLSSVSLEDEYLEDNVTAEDKQARMQSVFQQVRERIRSQVGTKAPKSSILELVQLVRDRETKLAQRNGDTENGDVSSEKKQAEVFESKREMDLKEVELCAVFEEKLTAREKALREECAEQISQVRKEMKEHIDHALKELESKLQNRHPHNPQQTQLKEQSENRGPDRKQKPSAAPSLAARRGRVLTRTMTTIIPKTCAPVIIGPRAKSETLSSSKWESSRPLLRESAVYQPGQRLCQSRRPLPPTCPPMHQRKKPIPTKAKNAK